jgi:hypothetical protein
MSACDVRAGRWSVTSSTSLLAPRFRPADLLGDGEQVRQVGLAGLTVQPSVQCGAVHVEFGGEGADGPGLGGSLSEFVE